MRYTHISHGELVLRFPLSSCILKLCDVEEEEEEEEGEVGRCGSRLLTSYLVTIRLFTEAYTANIVLFFPIPSQTHFY